MSIVPNPLAEAEAQRAPRRPWWHRWLVDAGAIAAAILIALGLGVTWLVLRARPQLDGRLHAAGLRAPATITRDELGVVHIRAQNLHDALFAEGYAMAQDRLFEMDLMRRRAEGQLAEIFGRRALRADMKMRRLGLRTAAKAEFERLPNAAGSELQAFSDGVNAYVNTHLSRLPLEFTLLRYRPRPWTDTDSLAIVGYMYTVLASNTRTTLAHARIAARLGAKPARELYPQRSSLDVLPGQLPGEGKRRHARARGRRRRGAAKRAGRHAKGAGRRPRRKILKPRRRARGGHEVEVSFKPAEAAGKFEPGPAAIKKFEPAEVTEKFEPGPAAAGSNNWVLGPKRSQNGKPILANDPHLPYQIPGIWWAVELRVVPPASKTGTAAGKTGAAAEKAGARAKTQKQKQTKANNKTKGQHRNKTKSQAHNNSKAKIQAGSKSQNRAKNQAISKSQAGSKNQANNQSEMHSRRPGMRMQAMRRRATRRQMARREQRQATRSQEQGRAAGRGERGRRGLTAARMIGQVGAKAAPPVSLVVEGVTLAGEPGVVIGHNRSIAWGVTNVGANVQQLVSYAIRLPKDEPWLGGRKPARAKGRTQHQNHKARNHKNEKSTNTAKDRASNRERARDRARNRTKASNRARANGKGRTRTKGRRHRAQAMTLTREQERQLDHGRLPAGFAQALANGAIPEIRTARGWQPLGLRMEKIAVRGGATVRYPVLLAPRGPIIGAYQGQVLALDWSLYSPGALDTMSTFMGIDEAQNWKQFERALALYPGPAQNFVYADTAGNIGYQCAGRIPKPNHPWRIQRGEQRGAGQAMSKWIRFHALPSAYNPASGLIATANGRITARRRGEVISREWEAPFRTHRIVTRLSARPRWRAAEMASVQMDLYSRPDWEMAQAVLAAAKRAQAAGSRLPAASERGLASLRRWHGNLHTRRDAPTLADRTLYGLMRTVLTAKLGTRLALEYRWAEWPLVELRWLRQAPQSWLPAKYRAQAQGKNARSGWDALLLDVFQPIAAAYAAHPRRWQWGRQHALQVQHPFYSHLWPLKYTADLGPQPIAGGRWTVKVNNGIFGPSMRFVADLGAWDRSTLTLFAGEAGEPLERHYRDQYAAWRRGRAEPLWFTRAAVKQHARHRLRLAP